MYVLGLKTSGHDTAAALVRDGEVLAACAEERFDRIKHSKNFPINSVRYCLSAAGISINDVDVVAIPFQYGQAFLKLTGLFTIRYFPQSLRASRTLLPYLWLKKANGEYNLKNILGYRGRILYLNHHDCHAASAFFLSGFESSAILTIDARGEWAGTRLYKGEGSFLKHPETLSVYPHSLGYFYTSITSYLGFERNSGEGKIMGLASYGDWRPFRKYLDIVRLKPDGCFELDMSFFDFHLGVNRDVSNKFISVFGPRREPENRMDKRHENIAAFAQHVLENTVIHLAKYAMYKLKETNLCLAGGVALNSVVNGIILRELKPRCLFIQPASTDDGAALGAALLTYYKFSRREDRTFQKDIVYLGPSYSDEEIERSLKACGLSYQKEKSLERIIVGELAKGKIVGWFQGRSEFGPRALGNRSILADPRDPDMKDALNSRVKFRESFRPFAAVVTEEECGKFLALTVTHPTCCLL